VSDWSAAGLPTEGTNRAKPRAGDLAHGDVITCKPDEPLSDVRSRIEQSSYDVAVVVNDEGVVAGLLRLSRLEAASDGARVDAVMELGPSTFRPNVGAEEMARYMTERDLPSAPITTSDGRLIGLLLQEDAVETA
jgi:Mg/Co/Ni transporter MgtE